MENNEQQQLALITEMISAARKEFNNNSFLYLLWGWAVSIAALAQFAMIKMGSDYNGIVWLICIPVALLLQIVFMMRRKKSERVKSHLDRIIGYVWIAAGVSFGVVLFSSNKMQMNTYPVLILLYGIGTFVSGGIMKLKPMMAGGICCWVIAVVTFYVTFDYQLLLLSLSLILAYIIPGHILQNRFRQNV